MLLAELGVRGGAVLGDADDHRAQLGELLDLGRELQGFRRAAGRVVLRIEVEHDVLALQARKADAAGVGGQVEIGGLVAGLQLLRHRHVLNFEPLIPANAGTQMEWRCG